MEDQYLCATAIIDSDHNSVREFASEITKKTGNNAVDKAVGLYMAVRDGIWYTPYYPFYRPEHYRASNVLKNGKGYCVSKASLLCALGRTCGIPSRVGFANVRNHLATRQLIEYIGTDVFVYHGFTEFYLENKWVRATPAFNSELCRRHNVEPLEFNGREDSLFHLYNSGKKKFMEYLEYHGTSHDIPVEEIVDAWRQTYGKERVNDWIAAFESMDETTNRDFYQEDILDD